MADFRTLDDAAVKGRRVLVRVDLNVPMKDGRVTDATRIDRILPTLRELAASGARIGILAHFGRPKGEPVPEMSLRPVVGPLAERLGVPVAFADDCIGDEAEAAMAALGDGQAVLLENTRFHKGEERNDPDFVARLAKLGEIYVNDAFSCAHRAHASSEGLAHRLPAYAGRNMEAELKALGNALERPERPLTAIVGGAKVSTKLALLGNLVTRVDNLIIGGGMANTFLHAQGIKVGASLCEPDLADTAREILAKADKAGCRIVLPTDAIVAREFAANAAHRAVSIDAVADDDMILDVGPESVMAVNTLLEVSKTLVWNGPLGAFETPPFEAGTVAVADHAANLCADGRLLAVGGGGDTVAALAMANAADRFTYVSTAGGAFLEWIEGRELPGVKALSTTVC
ncbi:phosphoglycerate kinase [Oceanibacterium hippocampi]|uniref:Phosphoglycerate kinase n=1 Tax=Oceanibacterium hippocampi TaxID=745714 RepID=A0A1Y5U0E0_9PROT|nr:phosphoglycerate kinase [Oceanibacterium hippocampi]SLN73461.1 Phosphoglycerate kinase [Oceanibacterium hippocampi]